MAVIKRTQFVNIDTEVFVGLWNGEEEIFEPGQSKEVDFYLAKAFADQLSDKLMLRKADKFLEKAKTPQEAKREPSFKDRKVREELYLAMRPGLTTKQYWTEMDELDGKIAAPVKGEKMIPESEVRKIIAEMLATKEPAV